MTESFETRDGFVVQVGKLSDDSRTVSFKCAFCDAIHTHGRPPLPTNYDHKRPHCAERDWVIIGRNGALYKADDGYFVSLDAESVELLYTRGIVPRPDQPPLRRRRQAPFPAPRPVASAPTAAPVSILSDEERIRAQRAGLMVGLAIAGSIEAVTNALARGLMQSLALNLSPAAMANAGIGGSVGGRALMDGYELRSDKLQ